MEQNVCSRCFRTDLVRW